MSETVEIGDTTVEIRETEDGFEAVAVDDGCPYDYDADAVYEYEYPSTGNTYRLEFADSQVYFYKNGEWVGCQFMNYLVNENAD